MLDGIIDLLAMLGGLALAIQLFRSVGRTIFSAAESAVASGAAESGLRRGDLTAMSEAQAAQKRAVRVRRTNAALSLILLIWIAVPLALGFVQEGYAVAAPIWLLPWAPLRRRVAEGA